MISAGTIWNTVVNYFHKVLLSFSVLTLTSRCFNDFKILYQDLKSSLSSSYEHEI